MSRLPRVAWAYSAFKDAYVLSPASMEKLLEQVYREGVRDGGDAVLAAASETAVTDEPDLWSEADSLPF